MDHIDLTKVSHEVLPSENGGILVRLDDSYRDPLRIPRYLTFSNPVDYMTYIAQGYQNTQREKSDADND